MKKHIYIIALVLTIPTSSHAIIKPEPFEFNCCTDSRDNPCYVYTTPTPVNCAMSCMGACPYTFQKYPLIHCSDTCLAYEGLTTCEDTCNITTNTTCPVGWEWQNVSGTNYQSRTNYYQDADCTSFTEYRCATGFYGTGGTTIPVCIPCEANGTTVWESNWFMTNTKTDCFIPANTPITDASGTYVYESDCYYSE